MHAPALPHNEPDRIAALRATGLLDTGADPRYDAVTRLAAKLFNVPIALVSLVDCDRQWFKSAVGLDASQTGRDISFCGHAILSPDPLVVEDTHQDPRFADNPLVTNAPNIRFYAGAPLHLGPDLRVGTLCLIDSAPRRFSDAKRETLRELAHLVETQIQSIQAVEAAWLTEWMQRLNALLLRTTDPLEQRIDQLLQTGHDALHAEALVLTRASDGVCEVIAACPASVSETHMDMALQGCLGSAAPTDPCDELESTTTSVSIRVNNAHFGSLTVFRRKGQARQTPAADAHEFTQLLATAIGQVQEQQAVYLQLKQLTALQTQVLDQSTDGIVGIDTRGGIRFINNAGCRMLDTDAQELIGTPCEQSLGLDPSVLYEAHGDAHPPGGIAMEALWFRRRSGERFPVDLQVTRIAEGAVIAFRDITERLATQAQLNRQKSLLESIFKALPDGVLFADSERRILRSNASIAKLFGYDEDDLRGRKTLFLYADRTLYYENGASRFNAEVANEIFSTDIEYRRRDGSTFIGQTRGLPVRDSDDNLLGFLGVIRDVTEQKQLEQLKEDFVSTVSHELRTPVTSIVGALGLLKKGVGGQLPPEAVRLIDIAHKNGERLTALIDDILDWESISSGQMRFLRGPVELNELCLEAVALNLGYAERFGVTLDFCRLEGRVWTYLDRDRVTQVLTNLISNAVKHSPPNETVRIECYLNGERAGVSVADQGPGVPLAFHDHIFHRFAQADATDQRPQQPGTGLGLAISQTIIQHHQGTIDFDRTLSSGARFFFELPLLLPVEEQPEPPQVLLYGDQQVAKESIELIERAGFDVDLTATPEATVKRLQSSTYDCVLLRLSEAPTLPSATLQELISLQPAQETPVLVISPPQLRQHVESGIPPTLPIIDWIVEPVDSMRLLRGLHTAARYQPDRPRVLQVERLEQRHALISVLCDGLAEVTAAHSAADAMRHIILAKKRPFDLAIVSAELADDEAELAIQACKQATPAISTVLLAHQDTEVTQSTRADLVLVDSDTNLALYHQLHRLLGPNSARTTQGAQTS